MKSTYEIRYSGNSVPFTRTSKRAALTKAIQLNGDGFQRVDVLEVLATGETVRIACYRDGKKVTP